jgi:outer membrane protein insertion porin family
MRQIEGSWYEGDKIAKTKSRVDRLGYFDDVAVETPAVPGVTDQVDLNVAVKKKPTDNVMLGAGFSSSEKLVLSGSVQQQNLFGSGKHVGAQINSSKSNKVYAFSYTDPYYTIDGVSRGFDIYRRDFTSESTAIGAYSSKSAGLGVRYAVPIAEDDYINFGLSFDATKLTVYSTSPQRYKDYVRDHPGTNTTLLSAAGWGKETLDSRIYPTKGTVQRLSGELSFPGGNIRYYRVGYQHQVYFPITRDYTVLLGGEASKVGGYGGRTLPFFKNLYAGGIGSVRGYESSSLGPLDSATQERLGGTRRLSGTGEFLFPMPGMGLDRSVRLGAFVDAGQVWGDSEKLSLSDLRYSSGISAAWNSPFGPLKFSFAQPLNKKSSDKVQRLQFTMGSAF